MNLHDELIERQNMDYSRLPLAESTVAAAERVRSAAEAVCGPGWNHLSNALRWEVLYVFEKTVEHLGTRFSVIDYLEIGSAHGVSLSVLALLLGGGGIMGKATSIDPYFEGGYAERTWSGETVRRHIDKGTKQKAHELYAVLGIEVEHFEETSAVALRGLLKMNRRFHLVYVDGLHGGLAPLRDFALSLELLEPNGVAMLDDHYWPDVNPVKKLCDRHLWEIAECWKVVAYEVEP